MVIAIEYPAARAYRAVVIGVFAGRLRRSFGYALRGVRVAGSGPNLRIQAVAGLVVVVLAIAYGVTGPRLGLLVLSIGAVLGAEIMNTAVERTCDLVAEVHRLGHDRRIRDIKDLAAAAVLVVAVGAAVTGVVVFGPYLA
jgi:diacylglycerol kinase